MSVPLHPAFAAMPGAFLDALGSAVTLTIAGGEPKSVMAIVRAPSGEVASGGGYSSPGATGRIVTISFAEADVEGIGEGATVMISGTTWKVVEPLPDGRGMVRCELERA